jgi:aspartate dehydrogenase
MKVGIAGLGVIGSKVAHTIDAGKIEGMHLAAVCSGSADKARRRMKDFRNMPEIVTAAELAEHCDIVVDCAPKAAFREIAEPVLEAGRVLITVSGSAILDNPDVIELARESGGRVVLATGALLGLDAIRAAAEGKIHSVQMVTRKPPRSLAGAPYLLEHEIDVESFTEAKQVFSGTAAEGARGFPSNVNVAAAVGLAGIGADRTTLEIWADPALERNTHTIVVDADSASFEMKIENIPVEENPGTGRITALSVIAALRGETASFRAGS